MTDRRTLIVFRNLRQTGFLHGVQKLRTADERRCAHPSVQDGVIRMCCLLRDFAHGDRLAGGTGSCVACKHVADLPRFKAWRLSWPLC